MNESRTEQSVERREDQRRKQQDRRRSPRRNPASREVLHMAFDCVRYSLIPIIVYRLNGEKDLYANKAAQREFGRKTRQTGEGVGSDFIMARHKEIVRALKKSGDEQTVPIAERNGKCYRLHYVRCIYWIVVEVFDTSEVMYDDLTGLPNFSFFRVAGARMIDEINRAKKDPGPVPNLALFFIDIDNFKRLNDVHGHALADDVLVQLAKRFRGSTRHSSDVFARRSGDEFLALAKVTHAEDALTFARRIQECLSDEFFVDDRRIVNRRIRIGRITVSIGFRIFQSADSFEAMLEQADAAMLKAKKEGRNQVVRSDPSRS